MGLIQEPQLRSAHDHRGERDVSVLTRIVEHAATGAPGPVEAPVPGESVIVPMVAGAPGRLVLDPAGYVVITPDDSNVVSGVVEPVDSEATNPGFFERIWRYLTGDDIAADG